MWSRPFARMVALSGRHATVVALLLAGLSVVMAVLAATRLSIDTDTNNLIAADLPWRQQERRVDRAFPQLTDLTLVLVTGETPAAADRAAAALADRLQGRHDLFRSVQRPDALPYFRQYGLLFRSEDELRDLSQKLVDAQPLLGLLASRPEPARPGGRARARPRRGRRRAGGHRPARSGLPRGREQPRDTGEPAPAAAGVEHAADRNAARRAASSSASS